MQAAKYFGIAVIALVILGGVLWYISTHPAPPHETESVATTTPTSSATPPAVIRDDSAYYEIEAHYPSAVSFPLSSRSDAGSGAQSSMKQWAVQSIAEFKAGVDFDALTAEDIEVLGFERHKYTFDIRYTVYAGTRTVSYVYSILQYTGGAHPNTTYRTFTFNATTGEELALSDLFQPGSDYLLRLSSITRSDLPDIIGEFSDASFIEPGTEPTSSNFKNFYLNGTQLVIVFPPYQVGPYALGPVSLPIELSRLSNVLKVDYR